MNTLYMALTFGNGAVGSCVDAFTWSSGGRYRIGALAMFLIAAGALILTLAVQAQGGDPHSHGA